MFAKFKSKKLKKFICMFAVVQIIFLSITSNFQVTTYGALESYYFFQSLLESYLFNSVRSSFSDNEELITTSVDDVIDKMAGEQAKEQTLNDTIAYINSRDDWSDEFKAETIAKYQDTTIPIKDRLSTALQHSYEQAFEEDSLLWQKFNLLWYGIIGVDTEALKEVYSEVIEEEFICTDWVIGMPNFEYEDIYNNNQYNIWKPNFDLAESYKSNVPFIIRDAENLGKFYTFYVNGTSAQNNAMGFSSIRTSYHYPEMTFWETKKLILNQRFNLEDMKINIPIFESLDEAKTAWDNSDLSNAINYNDNTTEIPEEIQAEIDANLAKQQEIKDKLAQGGYEVSDTELEDMIGEILSIVKTRAEEEPEVNIEDIVRTAVAEVISVAEPEPEPEPETQDWFGLFGWLRLILQAIQSIPDTIRALPQNIKTIMESVIKIVSNPIEAIKTAVELLVEHAKSIVLDIKDIVTQIKEHFPAVGQALEDIIEWIGGIAIHIADIWEWIGDIAIEFTDIWEWVGDIATWFADVWEWVGNIAIEFTDVWEWVGDIATWFEDVWEWVGDIAIAIPKIPAMIIDFFTIDSVRIKLEYDKIHIPKPAIFDKFTNYYGDLGNAVIEYPKIEVDTPNVLKPFYEQPTIVLLDFEDWKEYCIWARRIFAVTTYLAFGFAMIYRARPRLGIG